MLCKLENSTLTLLLQDNHRKVAAVEKNYESKILFYVTTTRKKGAVESVNICSMLNENKKFFNPFLPSFRLQSFALFCSTHYFMTPFGETRKLITSSHYVL